MTKKTEMVEENKVAILMHLRSTKKGILSSIFTLTFNLEAFDLNDIDSIADPYVTMFDDLFRGTFCSTA